MSTDHSDRRLLQQSLVIKFVIKNVNWYFAENVHETPNTILTKYSINRITLCLAHSIQLNREKQEQNKTNKINPKKHEFNGDEINVLFTSNAFSNAIDSAMNTADKNVC